MEPKDFSLLEQAYKNVYAEQQLDEFLGSGAQKAVDSVTKRIQGGLEKAGVKINRTQRGTVTKDQQQKRIQQNNSVDMFELIKGHLMSEGYADNEKAALAIMANMSEEWRESIIEQSSTRSMADQVTDALPWNRNTKYTTQGKLRKPGENVHGQQTGRRPAPTSSMTSDGKPK